VAFRRVEDEREERFTYGEVHRWAARVGSFLLRSEVKHGDRVLLVSENRPEWPIAYFGILRAGATVVPVDPESTETEVVNIVRRSEARWCSSPRTRRGTGRAVAGALRPGGGRPAGHPGPGDEGTSPGPNCIGEVRKSAAPTTWPR
jgi:long-chain acyl-CoA synthetase